MGNSEHIASTAEAIRRYLAQRPNASETVEGVAKWWLTQQRYDDSVMLVQRALDFLESQGEVVKMELQGGKVLYRRSITVN